jgi:excisionase family DNA binding protein
MSDKLLSTKEAAVFLRVSEASIRRWSDAGLLPGRRIGRRRERRLTEADLTRFLSIEDPDSAPRSLAVPAMVNVGGLLVPLRSHLAAFYNSDVSRLRITVPFLSDGLRAGQPCFLIAAGDPLNAYLEALRNEDGIDIDLALRTGQFVTAAGPGTTVEDALGFWEQAFGRALRGGPTVLRVAGEMVSERHLFLSDAQMMQHESAYDLLAKRFPVVTLCQYDVREFDGETVFHAVRSHPDLYGVHLGRFLN